MKKIPAEEYTGFIAEIKQSIIRSRYQAARLANREQLLLYLYVGKRITEKIEAEKWGAKVLEQLSNDLQAELPGLRGFSQRSLVNMCQFANEYANAVFLSSAVNEKNTGGKKAPGKEKKAITQSATAQLKKAITQSATAQMKKLVVKPATSKALRANTGVIFTENQLNSFFSISFTHHILLISKCKKIKERYFYMEKAAGDMWSVSVMEHQITSKLFKHQGALPNNFKSTLPPEMRANALEAFKDEYLFDFMSLDDTVDERVFEQTTVANIRKFILSLGKGFSFMGNQYKLEVDGNEYFIDLLFYNRILQCLVVFELKRGKFKPEYAGKLNFYLNVLDDKVRLQHEKPSIGIILCKEKNNTEVEYSFRSMSKAMGVAKYKLSSEVPKEMKGILPSAEKLKKLI